MLGTMQPLLAQYPLGFGKWLCALDYAAARRYEVAIIGDRDAPDIQAMLKALNSRYRPCHVVALGPAGATAVRLLQNRDQIEERATAHVCVTAERVLCLPPTTDPTELQTMIDQK
jgi:uncharacterized protein YyaL (SSP411 family)